MLIPNPNNGFVPKVGDVVKIVGACHPRSLGKLMRVTQVYEENNQVWFEGTCIESLDYSGGVCGGLELADMRDL